MRLYVDARLPWGSGIGRYVASILPHMVVARPDWTFVLGVDTGNDHPDLSPIAAFENVEVLRLDIAPFSMAEQRHLRRAIGPCDLAWFTNYWVPLFWHGPFVVTVHDLLHLRQDLFPSPLPKRIASQTMMRKLRRKARGIIFVSEFTCQEFLRRIGQPQSCRVIHHGSDHFATDQATLSKTKTALIVGAPKLHKNMELAIEAWSAAAPPDPWCLTVVSPGDALRSSISLGSSARSIEFRSGIPNRELARLYREAAIVLFPTKYEGFGFPILEAALNGARILSSTADALREVAQEMDICFLDPDDKTAWVKAIRETVELPLPTAETPEISQNMEAAKKYRWAETAKATITMLETSSDLA